MSRLAAFRNLVAGPLANAKAVNLPFHLCATQLPVIFFSVVCKKHL
jgi:hypothetical protein